MSVIIITGTGGFIGGNLARRLLETGVEVIGIDISSEKMQSLTEYKKFTPLLSDDGLVYSLQNVLGGKKPDVFFHLAWHGYGKDTNNFDVQIKNVVCAYEMAQIAGRINCKKFVLAESFHEYQKNYYNNKETERSGSCSIYGASKTAAAAYVKVVCHNYNMSFNGAVFANVFGEGDYSNRTANYFISKLLNGEDLDLVRINKLYDWVYIDDVTEALIKTGEKGIDGKSYYIGKAIKPFRSIIEELRDILSPKSKLNFGAYDDTTYIDYSNINFNELFNDTGFFPKCDFRDSVLKTANWLKQIGRVK